MTEPIPKLLYLGEVGRKRRPIRASDFFQDWWAEVTHGAKNEESFSEMMGLSISNQPQLTFG